jgi:hypothetical protein
VKFTALHRIVLLFTPLFIFTTAGSGAELPPDAQAAVKKGILAAKEQDYALAIRFFQDARKIAPDAPEIYYDLGLAESKIPGRELRAITWFGAYLAATHNPPNAAAVRDQIAAMDVRCQSNLSHLLQSLQAMVGQTGEKQSDQDFALGVIAGMWAGAGDMTKAISIYDSIQTPARKSGALSEIAKGQLQTGDIPAAIKTTESISDNYFRSFAARDIAQEQASSGDITSALQTASAISDTSLKIYALIFISRVQADARDIEGVESTTSAILKTGDRKTAYTYAPDVVTIRAKIGDISGAQQAMGLIDDPGSRKIAQIYIDGAYGDLAQEKVIAGDFPSARSTAEEIQDPLTRNQEELKIVEAQAKAGDVPGARSTAEMIQDAQWKNFALNAIIQVLSDGGSQKPRSVTAPTPVAQQSSGAPPISKPNSHVIAVSDWLSEFDQQLNGQLFIDPATYLTTRQRNQPNLFGTYTVAIARYNDTREAIQLIINEHNRIEKMLGQQTKQ